MYFVGVNGCKAGWLGVALTSEGYTSHRLAADFSDIAAVYQAGLILVDVPIGLRDIGPAERLCDTAARRVLGPRASSVFPAPCRSAIRATEYEAASTENRAKTARGLSKQSWALVPKIRQLDNYLRQQSANGPVVREVHPEVCFWGLAGRPMQHPKHRPEGRAERLAVLADVIANAHPKSLLGEDDVLDALVAAVTALLSSENSKTLPQVPEQDAHGLRMEMVYAQRRS
jgi:predicted RNase H-like nuclease